MSHILFYNFCILQKSKIISNAFQTAKIYKPKITISTYKIKTTFAGNIHHGIQEDKLIGRFNAVF